LAKWFGVSDTDASNIVFPHLAAFTQKDLGFMNLT
jgi:uncharacterized protein (DUF1501 family)